MVGGGQISHNSYIKRVLCRFYLASQHRRGALWKSATTALTASLISALSFLQISALPKLDNARGAEINSLYRHDCYRPYKIIVSYVYTPVLLKVRL